MKFTRSLLLSIGLLLCLIQSKAQQVPLVSGPGCLFNGKIYWNKIGTYTDGTDIFAGYLNGCTGTYSDDPNNDSWVQTGGNGSCTVLVDCSGTGNSNYKKGKSGYVSLSIPIDDYIAPLLLSVSALVLYNIRRQRLQLLS